MEEELDVERLAKITAYHEASHFVLALLMNKFDSSFEKPSKEATIKVIIGEPYEGRISSGLPGVSEEKELAKDEVLRIKQVFGGCFVLLSGYYSYNIFCDGCGNSIMETVPPKANSENILTKNFEMKSFTLKDKLKEICHPFYVYELKKNKIKINHDIKKTIDLLRNLWEYKSKDSDDFVRIDKYHDIILFLFNELNKLMREEAAVKDAIELVKDELLKNNGKVIEGKYLNDLIANAEGLIVNVDITEYLDACEKAYRNDDWYIPLQLPSNWVD